MLMNFLGDDRRVVLTKEGGGECASGLIDGADE